MSRHSRKQGAPQSTRDAAEYVVAVRRQLRLLASFGRQFDAGDEDVVFPLSIALRLLLQDRLLHRVMNLDRLRLIDSASYWGLETSSHLGLGSGLTLMRAAAGQPGSGRVVPALDAHAANANPDVVFRDWWSRDQVVSGWGQDFTREYVVLEMANTEAAHVDAQLDVDYLRLHSQSSTIQFDGVPTKSSVAACSVRQVAWELEKTIERDRPDLLGGSSD
jgi:hypothetical protein